MIFLDFTIIWKISPYIHYDFKANNESSMYSELKRIEPGTNQAGMLTTCPHAAKNLTFFCQRASEMLRVRKKGIRPGAYWYAWKRGHAVMEGLAA
jgi:hypothetical protein